MAGESLCTRQKTNFSDPVSSTFPTPSEFFPTSDLNVLIALCKNTQIVLPFFDKVCFLCLFYLIHLMLLFLLLIFTQPQVCVRGVSSGWKEATKKEIERLQENKT